MHTYIGPAMRASRAARWTCLAVTTATLMSVALQALEASPEQSPTGPAAQPALAPIPAPALEELVAEALANAPSLGARRARLASAEASASASDAPADPTVEFEYRDGGFPRQTFGSDPMTMAGASIRQPLLSKGRRTARRALAGAEVDQRHAEADATACDLTAAIREQYARLYALDRERAVLDAARQIADLLSTTASARYAAGGSDQATLLRAQLERTRLGERMTDVDGNRAAVVATLNRLVGRAADSPIGGVVSLPDLPALPGPLDSLPTRAAEAAPEIAVKKAEAQVASRRVESARAELRPTVSVGAGFYWQGGFDRLVSVNVGIELPLRKARKQLPLVAAAQHDLDAARFEQRDAEAEATAAASRLVADIRRSEDQMARYRSGLLPQSAAALDAARASYLGGRGDFASVVDEFRRWTDLRVELARREAAAFAARAQLDVLVNPAAHDWHPGHASSTTSVEKER